jgi:hypothetical protein
MDDFFQKPESVQFKTVFLNIWVALLFPWIFLAGLAGMALDGGDSFRAYAFILSTWIYPGFVGLAYVLRKNSPAFQLIPLIDIIAILFFGW